MKGNSVNSDKKGALITTCRKDYHPVFMLPFLVIAFCMGVYLLLYSLLNRIYLLILILLVAESGVYLSLRLFIFPEAIATTFKVYENGFIPTERTWKEWLFRKDTFVPFDEVVGVDVIYRTEYSDRKPSELKLDPKYVDHVKIHTKEGKRISVMQYPHIDEKTMKRFLEILKEKGLIKI